MKKILFSSQYIPPAWIAAHGFKPEKIVPFPRRILEELGEGICPFAELLLKNAGKDGITAVVFTTRCDQMRRISELLPQDQRVFLMHIPAAWISSTAVKIYIDEMQRLSRFLRDLGGTGPTTKQLIHLCSEQTDQGSKPDCGNRRKIALMGGPATSLDRELSCMIDSYNASISLDASEQGEICIPRLNPDKLEKSPLQEFADKYFVEMPDIAKRPNTQFYESAEKHILDRKIEAIIVRTYPWCDLWHAEIPRIKERFQLPVLNYTVDINTPPGKDARLKTRLKAFFEML